MGERREIAGIRKWGGISGRGGNLAGAEGATASSMRWYCGMLDGSQEIRAAAGVPWPRRARSWRHRSGPAKSFNMWPSLQFQLWPMAASSRNRVDDGFRAGRWRMWIRPAKIAAITMRAAGTPPKDHPLTEILEESRSRLVAAECRFTTRRRERQSRLPEGDEGDES